MSLICIFRRGYMMIIEEALKKQGFAFEVIRNEKMIYTAQEGAEYFQIDLAQIAPTLILYTSKGFYSAILSGVNRLDFKAIKNVLHCHNVRMATESEIAQVTGFSVGNIPMFGLNIPCFVDAKLLEYDFIYGGLGKEKMTLKVDPHALLKLNSIVEILQ